MEQQYWMHCWDENQIGFHQNSFNRLLEKYWTSLSIPQGGSVFVPLCGKSRDMVYLTQSGYKVIGAELSELAIQSFLSENGIIADRTSAPEYVAYQSQDYALYVGDVFDIFDRCTAGISAVYDRASLVALPEPMRSRFVVCQRRFFPPGCVIFLISLEYESDTVNPPPFAIEHSEIEHHYASWCEVQHLETIAAQIKGMPSSESVYRITVGPKTDSKIT